MLKSVSYEKLQNDRKNKLGWGREGKSEFKRFASAAKSTVKEIIFQGHFGTTELERLSGLFGFLFIYLFSLWPELNFVNLDRCFAPDISKLFTPSSAPFCCKLCMTET